MCDDENNYFEGWKDNKYMECGAIRMTRNKIKIIYCVFFIHVQITEDVLGLKYLYIR